MTGLGRLIVAHRASVEAWLNTRLPSKEITMSDRAPFPHCDSGVLHAPGSCEFCDNYPDLQAARLDARVNFTGQNVKGFDPCPATVRRSLDRIEQWHGNRAFPAKRQEGYTTVGLTPGFANFSVSPDAPGIVHIELRSGGDGERTGSQASLVPVEEFNRLISVV